MVAKKSKKALLLNTIKWKKKSNLNYFIENETVYSCTLAPASFLLTFLLVVSKHLTHASVIPLD